jgi:hypothetical protein
LSIDEIKVLNRGLTFVPTPIISLDPIVESIEKFSRHLKLQNYFSTRPNLGNYTRSAFTDKSTWTPPDSRIDKPVLDCIDSISNDIKTLRIQREIKNLNKNEFQAIKNLKNKPEIVIKKADKGSAVVVMDKCNYVSEGHRQLSNPLHYKQISTPLYLDNAKKISKILENLHTSGHLTTKEFKFLSPPENPRQRRFYMLPKIHKDKKVWPIPNYMPPGRPIVSDCNSESERIAMYIDAFIKPRANKHPSYIKNTYDFLDKVLDKKLSSDSLLITLDVESMYTNIDHDEGLKAVKNAFSDCNKDPKFIAIMELLELSLKGNDFEFDNKLFLQISGTAMGQKYAPHYADIYMAEFEKEALDKCQFKPDCYYRYLDDILIWPHGLDAFNTFLDVFNSHRPSIKFKSEISSNSVNFLDTTLYRGKDSTLQSKVFFKPTDTHQLLHKASFHPKHTFAGLIKSQVTRFYNICSNTEDIELACQTLFRALAKRNYSKRWLRKLKNETLRLLNKNNRPGALIINPTSSSSGCGPCNSNRCLTCDIVPKCHNFSGSVYDQTYSINSKMDCNSQNIIYLYTCKLCDKQYVGETGNSLRVRNNQHRTAINCGNTDDALCNHLIKFHQNTPNHSLDYYSLVAIEKLPDSEGPLTPSLDKLARLKREYCWIDTLCTFEPYGLNVQKFGKFSIEDKLKHKFDLFYIVPFSKTGNASAQIVKKHLKALNKKMETNIKIAVAYKKHDNLKNKLVRSKLPEDP